MSAPEAEAPASADRRRQFLLAAVAAGVEEIRTGALEKLVRVSELTGDYVAVKACREAAEGVQGG